MSKYELTHLALQFLCGLKSTRYNYVLENYTDCINVRLFQIDNNGHKDIGHVTIYDTGTMDVQVYQ